MKLRQLNHRAIALLVLGVGVGIGAQHGISAYRRYVIHKPLGGFHRQPSSRAIARLGKTALPDICTELANAWELNPCGPDAVVMECTSALGQMGDRRAVPILLGLTYHEHPWVRQMAAISLNRMPDARSVPAMRHLLNDEDARVREEAESALAAIPQQPSAKPDGHHPQEPDRFDEVARAAIDAVESGKTSDVAGFVSKQGLLVVRRTVDWKNTGHPLKEGAGSSGKYGEDYLYLDGTTPLVWNDVEVRLDRSDLTSRSGQRIIQQFQRFIRRTRSNYRTETYSLNMWDAWSSRMLGPAVEGKLLSDAYWYAYFVQESGKWWLYQLEMVIH